MQEPDLSGHCGTSTASARAQWALRDLNGERQISAGTAGPQLREPDLSGHCGTSTASASAQWALPDRNCESQISVGTACGTSIASARCHIQCQKRFQIECQNTCILPDRMSEYTSDRIPDRLSEYMSDRMSE